MTALLLLVMSLVVASMLYRSTTRTMEVAAEQAQQVVYNSATPAIDRAKAKLEYLFQQDPRLPGGLPSDAMLESIVLNDGKNGVPKLDQDSTEGGTQNPYLLPDEKAIDLDGDGRPDAAWTFPMDTDGDGEDETIAYSIFMRTISNGVDRTDSDQNKAKNLVVRNGPINLISSSNPNCDNANLAPDSGWDPVSSATVRRAFQVTALVISNDNSATKSVTTLEMQQDRQASRGNKWGAWMRNDLEVFPGPGFFWNGAIHTEGNLIIGDSSNFRSYLISSPASCLYTRDNSEVTISGAKDETTPPFQGQMIVGSMKRNNRNGATQFDIFAPNKDDIQTVTLTNTNDSVRDSNKAPADMSIDPVVVFTTNQNRARRGDPNNAGVRDNAWSERNVVAEGRIFNRSARAPYIDDTYRADDRYGPKPAYNDVITPFVDDQGNPTGRKVGEQISTKDPNYGALTNSVPQEVNTLGLDGYWERRAWAEGLRVIVGQRLELGNAYGWRNDDPLYLPQSGQPQARDNRHHEQKQWKSLRDNLAAVQSTAIYHSAGQNRNFPIACLATTAHPGTQTTIDNSTTFNSINGSGLPFTDFLTGNGTNGWEFEPPASNEASFVSALADGQPLRIALENLAHFAGDGAPDGSSDFNNQSKNYGHYGAFPPMQDDRNGTKAVGTTAQVHPYPLLSMWGDFSNLRRAIYRLDNTSYNQLSIADRTTLHTAACTLGMLAYNLDNILDYDYTLSNLTTLNTALTALSLPNGSTPENYIADLSGSPAQETAQKLYWKEQVERDRRLGFTNTYPYQVQFVNGFSYGGKTYDKDDPPTELGCDLSEETGNNFFGLGDPSDQPTTFLKQAFEQGILRIATSLCPTRPKFPSLFYLFPVVEHTHNGTASSTALAVASGATVTQPNSEPYIADQYIFNTSTTDDVNHDYTYEVLEDINNNNIEDGSDNGINKIAVQPRLRGNWQLPNTTTIGDRRNIITDNTTGANTGVGVALLDKGIFNGREMMSVRVLDFDLDMLRNSQTFMGVGDQSWLPDSGIIYAFREDAVREDGIARPRNANWFSCDTAAKIVSANCRMDAISTAPQDPPVNNITGISPKAVDFYADPDRRPYGFRLRNGADLRRIPDPPPEFALKGLAFISDNPVYIQADNQSFNLHNGEEFTQTLNSNWNNFYNRTTLNPSYGRKGDTWRPAEIIADAVTLLSGDFVDGSIAEGIRRQDVNRPGSDRSSYRTLNAPNNSNRNWLREDGSQSNNVNHASPIIINRNGFPLYFRNAANPRQPYGQGDNQSYLRFDQGKDEIDVNENNNTTINATIVSGLIPSRAEQSYGGLHNFPRFIENWGGGEQLHIAGAFIQLNFSTYATAPFDQDSWEPGDNAQSQEDIQYYGAPDRRWGYDVALQYAPAGPVATRFVVPGNTRSEFYQELPLDDPYILKLRCAEILPGVTIDPDVTEDQCQGV